MCKKTIYQAIRAFLYGVFLHGGILIIMNIPYYIGIKSFAIWDVRSTILIGGAGGLTFLASWFCYFLLSKIYHILIIEKENV